MLSASLFVINPAFAAEATDLAAKKTAVSNGPVTAPIHADAGQLSIDQNVAGKAAADMDLLTPASGNREDGVVVLPKTGEASQAVLELSRNGTPVAPAIMAWERDFDYYVPVADIARGLKFPSTFNASSQKIEGIFISPENTYSIDVSAGTYTVKGKSFPLPEGSVLKKGEIKDDSNLYVSPELLNKIWPLELQVDVLKQALTINTKRKLPFELEQERKKLQEKLDRQKKEQEREKALERNYVYTPNGYRLLGPQTFFITQSLSRDGVQKKPVNDLFISGQGDLLGTSATYSLNVLNSQDKPVDFEDFTFRMKREDYQSGKLLPYGLNLIDLGDISVRTPSLVSGSLQGAGVFISTDRNRRDADFDEVTLEGNAKPGWSIEVYRNGTLLDFGVVDQLGHYRFENVPLTFGNNPFRLVFYGPNGETEERTENYNIARSFLKPGEMTYQAGLVKRGNRVLNITGEENRGKAAGTFRVNRGISRYLSGYATFTDIDLKGHPEKYLSVGANFSAFDGYGQVEAYKQLDRGTALDVLYARNFLGYDASIRASIYRDFESPRSGTDDNRKETDINVSAVKTFILPFASLNFGFSASHTTYADAPSEARFTSSQSAGTPIGNFSNTSTTTLINKQITGSAGQAVYTKSLSDNFGFNSKLSYDLYPQPELNSLGLNLSFTDNDRLTASLGYGQSLLNTSSRSVNLGAAYDFDAFTGNAALGWETEGGVNVTLSASTTLGPHGKDNIYDFKRVIDGQPTRLSVLLYEDLNNDGSFGPEDKPVPGARVVLNGGKKSAPTDEKGQVEIAPAGSEGLTTITLDRPSLTYNPFLISEKKDGYITILRAGTEPHIDFPLIMSGTIDGTVRDQSGHGMPGITVQLIDTHGELVGESTTLADGFYTFELVRPGRHVVQIHPSHRVFVPPKTVVVASDDLFVYGADLQVLSNQSLGQASEAAVATDVEEIGRVAHTYHPQAAVGTEMPVSTPSDGGVQTPVSKDSISGGGVQTAPGISESGVQTAVRTVRIGEYPDKVRLVLDLSGPAAYQITKEDNGSAIIIDLPDTMWDADYNFAPDKQNLFQNIEINQLPEGGTRIKLTGNGNIDVSHDLSLPAETGKNDRIYIDFTRSQ